jgi:hypothetical protein
LLLCVSKNVKYIKFYNHIQDAQAMDFSAGQVFKMLRFGQ